MARNDPLAFDPIDEARRQWLAHGWEQSWAMVTTTSIMRAHQIVQRAVDDALAPFDLTFARYEALVLISFSRAGELPLGKMGDRLMVHPASVTNAIDRLERQGLVERRRSTEDRRTVLAVITDEGRRVATEASAALAAVEYGVKALAADERITLYEIIRVLREAEGDFHHLDDDDDDDAEIADDAEVADPAVHIAAADHAGADPAAD